LAKVPEKPQKSILLPDSTDSDDLAQEIAKRIGSLVPQSQKAQVVAQVVSLVTEERFSGPIAHPRHLKEYEEICPGAADRIIRMAENNLSHAQSVQILAVEGDISDVKAGRRYGFFALLSLIIAASTATYFDHEVIAGLFLGAGALGVIGQLIQGRQRNSDS
jgi:uncharacterized membrane protein